MPEHWEITEDLLTLKASSCKDKVVLIQVLLSIRLCLPIVFDLLLLYNKVSQSLLVLFVIASAFAHFNPLMLRLLSPWYLKSLEDVLLILIFESCSIVVLNIVMSDVELLDRGPPGDGLADYKSHLIRHVHLRKVKMQKLFAVFDDCAKVIL